MAFMDMGAKTFGIDEFPLAAVAVNAGEIACWNASGYATPGAVATGLIAFGVFYQTVDNSGGSAGDETALVAISSDKDGKRVFPLLNSAGGDAVTQAGVGRDCYIAGPNTVADNDGGGNRSRAGKVWGFDDEGRVMVEFDVDPDAVDLSALDARVDDLELAVLNMQAVNATLAAGTVTINSGITVSAASEVVPVLIGALSGTTNFGQLGELKASRVNGAPGVGTVVIQAYGDDGALDADAAGAIRVLIFTPAA